MGARISDSWPPSSDGYLKSVHDCYRQESLHEWPNGSCSPRSVPLGDLHPFIAVALALKAAGLVPTIAATDACRAKVEAEGLLFHPVRPTADQLAADTGLDESGGVRKMSGSSVRYFIRRLIIPYLAESFEDLMAAAEQADLVVSWSFAFGGRLVAAKLGLPTVSLLLSATTFLSSQDPPHIIDEPWVKELRRLLGSRAVKAVFAVSQAMIKADTRGITRFRKAVGLAPIGGDEVIDEPLRADRVIALYSPVFAKLPPGAPPNSLVAGFTFYDNRGGGLAPTSHELDRFLSQGGAPIVFTLGSLVVNAAGPFYEQSIAIARRLNRRAVLLVGSAAEARFLPMASEDIFICGYAPHSLVFPRGAAIVHHGGAGTVGQALRAGRPQLVCPALGDQVDNAERLVSLGVARRLDLKRFSVDRATALLRELLGDAPTRRAADIAPQIAREDGAAVAAAEIAGMLSV